MSNLYPTQTGKASNDILTNERPLVGNCSVTPSNGTALETNFNVICVDWSDPDMPLNYRYAKRLKPDESWTWMYSGKIMESSTFVVVITGIVSISRIALDELVGASSTTLVTCTSS